MLKSLEVTKGIKHSGKTFHFTEGLNTISGANETGKSYIIESINFCMFGASALRKPANTYFGLDKTLTFEIKNVTYKLRRTLDNAWLTSGETLLAKGNTAVTTEVRKILGYGFEVYNVANYAGQSDIEHLSGLGKTERKRIIDNVIGLSAIEKVLKAHKETLNASKRYTKMVEGRAPTVVAQPSVVFYQDLLDGFKAQQLGYQEVITTQQANKASIEAVEKSKPVEMQKPREPLLGELSIADIQVTQHKIETAKSDLTKANSTYADATKTLTKKVQARDDNSMKRMSLNSLLETLEEPASVEEIDALNIQWESYRLSQNKQKLIDNGHVDCEACNHRNYLAGDALKSFEHVALDLPKPDMTIETLKAKGKKRAETLEQISILNGEADILIAAVEAAEETVVAKSADATKASQVLNDLVLNWHSDEDLMTHLSDLTAQKKYEQYLTSFAAYSAAVKSLPTYDPEILRTSSESLDKNLTRIKELETLKSEWDLHKKYLLSKGDHETELKNSLSETAEEEKVVEFLLDLQSLIKSNLLPRVNAVASTWLQRITDGMHTSVELTSDMDILVDSDMIEGLSGSGKAVGHLSLRMALGQVLTRGVLPLFLCDEVNSSMDVNRSALTIRSLRDMLNGGLRQLVMVSHHPVEGADNEIKL